MECVLNDTEISKHEIVLTKIDAAERQLNQAIRMFFQNGEPVSILTLTAASHGVLRDLAHHKGIKKSLKDSPLIPDTKRAEYINQVHVVQNFVKHARNKPNQKIIFRPNATVIYILDTIALCAAINTRLSNEMSTFLMWLQLRYPNVFCMKSAEKELSLIRKDTSDPEIFKKLALVLLERAD